MGQTTKQHYVPQFYLRNFTAPGRHGKPFLWIYDKDGGVPRPQTPRNTMTEYGFYDFENSTGDIHATDKGMQQLEAAAAPILKRLEEPDVELTNEEIALFAHFLAVMYLRVPRTLKAIEEHREIFAFEALNYGTEQPEIWQQVLAEHRQKYGDRARGEEELLKLMQEAEKHYRVEPDHEDSVVESLKHITPIAEIPWWPEVSG